ncbi:uncharacterized protein LOC136091147 [Hydra vulgaris]|uniref:Uncharacterized protein LOC136091147 n=1 Tax=Hydra vulgaris TaxID=6087 RepID=A0ABM4DI82_HYDVU
MFGGRPPVCNSELKEEIGFIGVDEEEVKAEVEKSKIHIENLTNLVTKNIEEAQIKQKKYYDRKALKNIKIEEESIKVGDKVLLLDIRGRRNKGAAFKPRFKGPYNVCCITRGGNFKLNDDNKVPLKETHKRCHLKKFVECDLDKEITTVNIEQSLTKKALETKKVLWWKMRLYCQLFVQPGKPSSLYNKNIPYKLWNYRLSS